VLANTSAPDSPILTPVIVQQPTNGTVTISNGVIDYTPNSGVNSGTDSFQYAVTDGILTSNPQTVQITISSSQELVANPVYLSATENAQQQFTDQALLADVQNGLSGSTLSIVSVNQPTNGSLTWDQTAGDLEYTPAANFTGLADFSFIVANGAEEEQAQAQIQVQPPEVITVVNNQDNGNGAVVNGSLRAAVARANAAANGAVINFAPNLLNQTITLLTPITVTTNQNVTIQGQSSGGANLGITISGGPTGGANNAPGPNNTHLLIFAGGGTDTVSDLTLANGLSQYGGAAIYAMLGNLVLNADTIKNNADINGGGAVWVDGGNLTATNCIFTQNAEQGTTGGAIWLDQVGTAGGNGTLTGCNFSNNTAQAGGGAVYAQATNPGVTLTVTSCQFISNSSYIEGGALDLSGCNGVLSNDVFSSNRAYGNGGAVNATGSGQTDLEVTNCNFGGPGLIGNSALTPDGLYSKTGGWGGAIFTNSADSGGGAIAYWPVQNSSSSMSLNGTAFLNNQGCAGGAVNVYLVTNQGNVNVRVDSCLFQGNKTIGDVRFQEGGGLKVSQNTSGTGSASCAVTDSTFYANSSANYGGALYLANDNTGTGTNTMELAGLTVTQNQAVSGGGGLYEDSGSSSAPEVSNNIIASNLVTGRQPANGPDVLGKVISQGGNFIGVRDGSTPQSSWIMEDHLGTAANPLDPNLDPAGPTDNGGDTNTIVQGNFFGPATITVTSAADIGPGTLRAAVKQANQAARATIINFAPRLLNQTITLGSELTVETAQNVTIIGQSPGGANLGITISGGPARGANNTNLFMFNNGVPTTVTVSNLTMANGLCSTTGAAIDSEDNLTLIGDTFMGNIAQNSGGAVETSIGFLDVTNCSFMNNQAQGRTRAQTGVGGAIWAGTANDVDIVGSQFFDNTANSAFGAGGAIYAVSTNDIFPIFFQVANCVFSGNSSGNGGGAVGLSGLVPDWNCTLTDDTFTRNRTFNGNGGAVASWAPALQVNDCKFNNNIAATANAGYDVSGDAGWGGAIFSGRALTVNGTQYNGSAFNSNQAASGGGAIYYAPVPNSSSSMSLSNTTFLNNQGDAGGAVNVYVTTNLGTVNSTITGCLFQGNKANALPRDAGYARGGAVKVSQSTSGTGSASFTITNCTLYGNSTAGYGGALYLYDGNTGTGTNTITLTSLTVTQNQAASGGGGIYIYRTSSSLPQLDNSIFAGNLVTGGQPANGPDVLGPVSSLGYNLFGVVNGCSGYRIEDYTGTAQTPLNPGLDPAGPTNNGGFTNTVQLLEGSPAYEKGDPGLQGETDQRGFWRAFDVSIGAYDPDA
jgi:hypothetical protein